MGNIYFDDTVQVMPGCDDTIIWDLWLSSYHMPVVAVADSVGIFNTLTDQPATVKQVSGILNLDDHAVSVLFSMLTALNLLDYHEGLYQLTEASRNYLLPESPFYWGGFIHVIRNSLPYYQQLLSVVKGKKGSNLANNIEVKRPIDSWESGQVDIESAKRIAAFMHSHSIAAATGLSQQIDLAGVDRLLDVGGGSGCFSIAFVQQNPELLCTIMELPAMCEIAREYIKKADAENSIDTCAVDMFRQAWPGGYDAMFFSNIFHDWGIDTCTQLASHAYESLLPGGRICLHEILLDDSGTGPLPAAAFSVAMIIGTQGRQYSYNELRDILEAARFVDINMLPANGYYSLVTGYKLK